MYLKECLFENIGPITFLDLSLPFNEDGTPQPLILVGSNGSGKSIFLSNIVDALMEFSRFVEPDSVSKNLQRLSKINSFKIPDFKELDTTNQKLGSQFGISLLEFQNRESGFCSYIYKTGYLEYELYKEKMRGRFRNIDSWPNNKNARIFSKNKDIFKKFFEQNVVCYFPSSRREYPHWLSDYPSRPDHNFWFYDNFSGKIKRPIFIEIASEGDQRNEIPSINRWVLDIYQNAYSDATSKSSLRSIEEILSIILQEKSKILQDRFNTGEPISIKCENYIIPSLNHLSTGQSTLFNLFAKIIQYIDRIRFPGSVDLGTIEGIVIIDEIDAHLHTELQYNALPKLLNLFPKIQFIVTTHSPLFLLGMENSNLYTQRSFKLIEMPDAGVITTERFSEFKVSFNYYRQTKLFEEEVKTLVKNLKKPIVITEGKTDARIIRTAWNKLFPEKLMPFEIIPVGIQIEEENREGSADLVRRTMELITNIFSYPIIGLFDNDQEGNKQFKGLNGKIFEAYDINKKVRKHKTKNTWGLLLPIPQSRSKFVTLDEINERYLVIEHYFSNELLSSHNMCGRNVLGTEVFRINGNKDNFASSILQCRKEEFINFDLLFYEINYLLSTVTTS